ncbi:glycosyltransferase family 2 protein [Micromonospora zhanjiangensis]
MVTRIRPRPLTTRPTVSVVIPCYNYGHYLPECVHSVLSQSGVEVDVLIVDDASPDGSAEVARELSADPRVRLIAHRENRGHIATYNEGLAAVDGEYVVLLSADDLLSPARWPGPPRCWRRCRTRPSSTASRPASPTGRRSPGCGRPRGRSGPARSGWPRTSRWPPTRSPPPRW